MTEIVSLSRAEVLIYEAGSYKGQADAMTIASEYLESTAAHYEADFRGKIEDEKQLEEAINGLVVFRSVACQLKQRSDELRKQANEKTDAALKARDARRSLPDRARRAIIKAFEEFRK